MAVSKAELIPPIRDDIVKALADVWEKEVDEKLRAGYRRLWVDNFAKIRTRVTIQEHEAALNEFMGRYRVAGWRVIRNDAYSGERESIEFS